MNTHLRPLLILVAAAPFAHAIDATAWRFTQEIDAPAGSFTALDLPDATLGACRGDLADIRIVDANGTEVPYVIERPRFVSARENARVSSAKNFATTLEGNSTRITLETGTTEPVDGVDLFTPGMVFLKPVRVEGSADGVNWTTLAEGVPIFRQKNGAESLRVNFPGGSRMHLRITVDDAKDDPVPFTGAMVRGVTKTGSIDPRVAVPVTILKRDERAGSTRLTLDLGAANLPLSGITLDTPEPLFTRRVTASFEQTGEESVERRVVAMGSIWNITGVGNEPSVQKRLAVETQVPRRELLLTIDNGDSPPLAITGVSADRRPRRILFFAPPGALRLLSGNPEASMPRYDLGSLTSGIRTVSATAATLGRMTPNPGYKPFVPTPPPVIAGAAIDTGDWGARKPVALTTPGAQRLELDAGTLAFSRADLADLRLVRDGKQTPFLAERTGLTRELPVTVKPDDGAAKPGVTRLVITLPKGALPITEVSCRTDTEAFSRNVRLLREESDVRSGKREVRLAAATWTRQTAGNNDNTRRLALTGVPLSGTLILEIEDAGGAPLALSDFAVRYPATRLVFATADTGTTWLYYNNPDATAPRYDDLQVVAPQLRAAHPNIASAGAEERLSGQSRSPMKRYAGPILWVSLAAVVAGLLFAVAKMLPKSDGDSAR
jgi:hypothetical protein